MPYFRAATSSSSCLTTCTIFVHSAAVSRFSMYFRRFLWFSTLKLTPAVMSRKSIVFWSLVYIPSSDSASESVSPGLPTFFLSFYVLLFGSLLNAACCAAPSIKVNFYFSSKANSCSSCSCIFRSPCGTYGA